MDIVARLRDLEKPGTAKLRIEAADTIEAMRADVKDEKAAQKRADKDAKDERADIDAGRYLYLRDQVRVGGVIDEQLYVRCDGRTDGKWALDGRELDDVVDAAIAALPVPVMEET